MISIKSWMGKEWTKETRRGGEKSIGLFAKQSDRRHASSLIERRPEAAHSKLSL